MHSTKMGETGEEQARADLLGRFFDEFHGHPKKCEKMREMMEKEGSVSFKLLAPYIRRAVRDMDARHYNALIRGVNCMVSKRKKVVQEEINKKSLPTEEIDKVLKALGMMNIRKHREKILRQLEMWKKNFFTLEVRQKFCYEPWPLEALTSVETIKAFSTQQEKKYIEFKRQTSTELKCGRIEDTSQGWPE